MPNQALSGLAYRIGSDHVLTVFSFLFSRIFRAMLIHVNAAFPRSDACDLNKVISYGPVVGCRASPDAMQCIQLSQVETKVDQGCSHAGSISGSAGII